MLFERALALDQDSVAAQSWLAIELTARVLDFMADTAAADIARAEDLAERALAASPRSPLAHFAKGQVLRAQHRYDEAIPEYETVIALNRNWANAYSHLGWCKFMTGSIEELIPAQEQAIRLSPRDPQIGLFYSRIGCAHLLQSRTDEAILWCEKARNATPAQPLSFGSFLASAYALKGETERGRRRARRSPQAGRRRSLLQHRPLAGRRTLGRAEGLLLGRSHLFRRSAQGRGSGGIKLGIVVGPSDRAGHLGTQNCDASGNCRIPNPKTLRSASSPTG